MRFIGSRQRAEMAGRPLAWLQYNCGVQKVNIFLSHITVESKLADILRMRLLRDFIGLVEVFESSDRLSIPAGAKWLLEVTEALQRANLHIVLCSPEAISRPWIQFEAGGAHIRGITIIPVCHSGLTCAQLSVPLSESEGIEAWRPEGLRSLYQTIADALGSTIPEIDFQEFAKEVVSFQSEYESQRDLSSRELPPQQSVERIRNPRALCISSPQFVKLGFENQLQTVLNAFPEVVPHQRVFSSGELQKAISNDQGFDIVHIAAFVCPRSGHLFFSDVDLMTGKSTSTEQDVLSPEALASLLQVARAKLVVIGSCDSLVLGATLVNVCHVIAARDMVSPKMMAAWVEAFYGKLSQRSLLEALDYALKISQAPMRFYARQTKPVDMRFMREPDHIATSA